MSARRSLAIARNELRVLRRDPATLVVLIVMPLLVVPIFRSTFRAALVLAGRHDVTGAEFAVPGQTVEFLFFLAPTVGFAFFREHGWNTWERLRTSAANGPEIIAGKALPMLALGAAQLVVLFGVGVLLLDLHIDGSVTGTILVSAALLLCVVALGVAITALARTMQQVATFGYLGATVFGAVGGALVPASTMPGWVRAVAPVTPQYWAMRGYNAMILDRHGLGAALRPTVMLLAYAAVFTAIALARFRFDDAKVAFA